MKVTDITPRAYEFACHSKACAPPPAGHGGSDRGGHAVTGPKRPLTDSVTGRINPSRVRTAFRQNPSQSAGNKGPAPKRTEKIGETPITRETYRGRNIKHLKTGGGVRGTSQFPSRLYTAGGRLVPTKWMSTHTSHKQTTKKQRNLLAESIAKFKTSR